MAWPGLQGERHLEELSIRRRIYGPHSIVNATYIECGGRENSLVLCRKRFFGNEGE
jgi:hypothetical protein